MIDTPADYRDQLDLRGVIAEIDCDRAEARKRQGKMAKFAAEQYKAMAEDAKLRRDRWLWPRLLLASATSGVVVAIISHLWR